MAVAALPTSGAGAGVAVSSVAVRDAGALVLTQSHRIEAGVPAGAVLAAVGLLAHAVESKEKC